MDANMSLLNDLSLYDLQEGLLRVFLYLSINDIHVHMRGHLL